MKMKLQLIADSAPSMAFQSDKIMLTTSGDVYAFAILPNSTLIPLFNVKLVSFGSHILKNDLIYKLW